MLDLWLLWFSASYSTLAQFMMNYGNEWDMDLILSYVGTQIWGTAENHVLLLTSRKSCLVTSRGKLVHAGNTGWDERGARLHALVARAGSEQGLGCFELSWCAILWLNSCTARLRRFSEAWAPARGHSEVNDHCGKNQRAPKQYNKWHAESAISARVVYRNNSIRVCYARYERRWVQIVCAVNRIKARSKEDCFFSPMCFFLLIIKQVKRRTCGESLMNKCLGKR